jgi:hypothetical protein
MLKREGGGEGEREEKERFGTIIYKQCNQWNASTV